MLDYPFTLLPQSAYLKVDAKHGDVLFREGQPTSGMFVALTGAFILQRTTEQGDDLTLYRASAGSSFGEASVFADRYHCNAICVTHGEVNKISKQAVLDAIANNAEFARTFSAMLAKQVQKQRTHIELLGIKSAKQRVLYALRAGYLNKNIVEFASQINLTHEACYRVLRELRNDGKIYRSARGQYKIAD